MKRIVHEILINKLHPVYDIYRINMLKVLMISFIPLLFVESIAFYNMGFYLVPFIEIIVCFTFLFFFKRMWKNIHYFANAFIVFSFLLCIISFTYYIEHNAILIFFIVFPTYYIYFLGFRKGIITIIISCLILFVSATCYYYNYQELPWPKESLIIAMLAFLYICILTSAYELTNKSLVARLKEKAEIDGLTNIFTRRTFFELFEHELERARRHSFSLSLFIFDLDYFKSVNDNYGHPVGDEVLCHIVKLCVQSLRKSDIVGRIGGEEFACLIPDTDGEAAKHVAEKIRRIIDESNHKHLPHCTVSIGITEFTPNDTSSQMYQRADKGLYAAKSSGRNCIVKI